MSSSQKKLGYGQLLTSFVFILGFLFLNSPMSQADHHKGRNQGAMKKCMKHRCHRKGASELKGCLEKKRECMARGVGGDGCR